MLSAKLGPQEGTLRSFRDLVDDDLLLDLRNRVEDLGPVRFGIGKCFADNNGDVFEDAVLADGHAHHLLRVLVFLNTKSDQSDIGSLSGSTRQAFEKNLFGTGCFINTIDNHHKFLCVGKSSTKSCLNCVPHDVLVLGNVSDRPAILIGAVKNAQQLDIANTLLKELVEDGLGNSSGRGLRRNAGIYKESDIWCGVEGTVLSNLLIGTNKVM